MRSAWCILALSCAIPLLAAQTEDEPGRLVGRVTSAHTGEAVRGAFVEARGDAGQYTTRTGADGSYAIEQIRPGTYRVAVDKPAFARVYGATPELVITAGAETEYDARLLAHPALSGTVVESNGEPAQRKTVAAYRVEFQESQRYLTARFDSETDDRGRYRIYRLPEGAYVVRAEGTASGASQAGETRAAPSVFYPAAPGPASAQILHLEAGREVEGIDFRLPEEAHTTLDVFATKGDGGLCAGCNTIQIVQRDGNFRYTVVEGSPSRQGALRIHGLAPGSYWAIVYGAADRSARMGQTDAEVVAGERTSVTVALAPNVTVSGRVTFDVPSGVDSPATGRRLRLVAEIQAPWLRRRRSAANINWDQQTGEFTANLGSPGAYKFRFYALEGAYLRSVSVAGRDLGGAIVDIGPAGFQDLLLDYAYDGGTVTARVEDGDNAASWVKLVPASERWGYQTDEAERIAGGAAQLTAIPPGVYEAYAVGDPSEYDFSDPAIRAQFRDYAQSVTVRAGETAAIALTPLPARY